ncbi:NAD(P)/FAD-dependent oxidoreductase [Opitutus terrae]|uniref:Putative electron transfer oxidoreductase n=1 Tax=Opitutus terrae (strain DSM 11246 / JCM 15787 / PB90-1) TaxID=452637 RepID=B1ZWF9_OPITP|nr:electron transfer oxidoreductase [Opitutus terrae]ACB76911.1 putative electron transfer oxidoreductase [Opitutus terrae PB90-1]
MNTSRPIEIIGGGLAGLSLGLALRRAGVDVNITEAGSYPRHRVCGEFITGLPGSTRTALGLDALLADAVVNRQVAWFAAGEPAWFQALPSPALSLSRYVLDARLAEAFVAAGGELRSQTRSAAHADAPGRVFATGRRRARSPWIGLKLHAIALPLAADLEVHLGASCYVGLARIESGRANICGLFRRAALTGHAGELLLAYLRHTGLNALATRLAAAELDSASFSAVAAVEFDRRIAPTPQARLGDACAVIPPFTGHGMAMAFQSAEIALAPLLAYARGHAAWPATRRVIQSELRRRFRVRLTSAAALHPFLLEPPRQRWFARLGRARLLPFGPLYHLLH